MYVFYIYPMYIPRLDVQNIFNNKTLAHECQTVFAYNWFVSIIDKQFMFYVLSACDSCASDMCDVQNAFVSYCREFPCLYPYKYIVGHHVNEFICRAILLPSSVNVSQTHNAFVYL